MHLRFASLLLTLAALAVSALAANDPRPPEPALMQRAEKIVAKLGLSDDAQAERIRLLIARQYEALRPIHEHRDNAIKLARALPDKAEAERAVAQARDTVTARQTTVHYAFLARLAAELTPEQIEQVKDGMTYGVLPNTFRVYQLMLPDLTDEQRRQIHAWLIEAREHALTAGSSEEKHGWFGKYKGRINNYLSAAGYNLKEAEKNLRK